MGASLASRLSQMIAYCIVLAVALAGNVLVTAVIARLKNTRKTIDYFVANMACSDLIFPILVLPRIIVELLMDHQRWLVSGPLGLALCKLVPFLQDTSTAVSNQSLVLIAIDRFNAVVFPLHPPIFSKRVSRLLIALTWAVALALHSPYVFMRRLSQVAPNTLVCHVDWVGAFGSDVSHYEVYTVSMFVLVVIVPFALLTVLYTIIVIQLKRINVRGKQLSVHSDSDRQRRFKQERKVLKMALAVVISFGLSGALLNIYVFLFFFVWDQKTPCNTVTLRTVAMFTFLANCAVNPCICLIFSEKYRQGLKRLLCCRSDDPAPQTSTVRMTEVTQG